MDTDQTLEQPPQRSKIVPILMMLNLAVTAFVCVRVLLIPTSAAVAGDTAEDERTGPDRPGPLYEIEEPFIVNLNEPAGGRYLKLRMTIELADGDAVSDLDKAERIVRDDLLRYFSELSVAETMGEKSKNKIHDSIVARIDERLGGGDRVTRVFFSEFVVH